MQISLGPLLYYWPRQVVFDFYEAVAASPVHIVYLGESVCSRRHESRLSDWLDIGRMLQSAGKDVLLSTQVLVESGADVTVLHKIAANGQWMVEANDMGAVHCLVTSHTPFVAGPHLNIYNLPTLQWLAQRGGRRWVVPVEMAQTDLALVLDGAPAGLQTEVLVYGRMPLAFSARCFTARHHNVHKDECEFKCIDDPDGLVMRTREGEDFLVINGIQTQSARVCQLLPELPVMQAMGINVLRISPQSQHTDRIISVFHRAMNKQVALSDALAELTPLMPGLPCNGYWHGKPGLETIQITGR